MAAAIEAGDGYGLIESAMDLSFVPRIIVVFGVAVGLESIAMQLVAPPPFVTPSPSWFASPDFVAATAHAITITRLINSSSRHPGQNFFQLSTVPYLVLQASWIHVLTIRSMIENAASNPTEGNDPIANSSMFVDLIEDTNICLEFVRMNATVRNFACWPLELG